MVWPLEDSELKENLKSNAEFQMYRLIATISIVVVDTDSLLAFPCIYALLAYSPYCVQFLLLV